LRATAVDQQQSALCYFSVPLSRTGLIGGANEIHGVEVPILEIHLVDIVTARTIEDTTDFGPDRSHGAHPAGLQGATGALAAPSDFKGLPLSQDTIEMSD
jgi:hypothetical protein